jgi:hypothetical protein
MRPVHDFETSEYRVTFTASNVLFRVVFKLPCHLSFNFVRSLDGDRFSYCVLTDGPSRLARSASGSAFQLSRDFYVQFVVRIVSGKSSVNDFIV